MTEPPISRNVCIVPGQRSGLTNNCKFTIIRIGEERRGAELAVRPVRDGDSACAVGIRLLISPFLPPLRFGSVRIGWELTSRRSKQESQIWKFYVRKGFKRKVRFTTPSTSQIRINMGCTFFFFFVCLLFFKFLLKKFEGGLEKRDNKKRRRRTTMQRKKINIKNSREL